MNDKIHEKQSWIPPAVEMKTEEIYQYVTDIENEMVSKNTFLSQKTKSSGKADYEMLKEILPEVIWEGHEKIVEVYEFAWKSVLNNTYEPKQEAGFISNYVDTVFNNCLFMWDSCFVMMFTKYGSNAFDFQQTLDNFYHRQHKDGYICRELDENRKIEKFEKYNPSSTGPNILAWAEYEYYLINRDVERLEKVFFPLVAYHRWLRAWRTWRDGLYYASGWGCGMDNQPRIKNGLCRWFHHGNMAWIDTTLQQILSAKLLSKMAVILEKEELVQDMAQEAETLSALVNEKMWDKEIGFYFDLFGTDQKSDVKSIAGFWALLAQIADRDKKNRLKEHLENETEFNRPHRVPSLSADHEDYRELGDYWCGGVWSSTNYMVVRGLVENGESKLAHEIARNHVEMVAQVFESTGELWEDYAPETAKEGYPAKANYVGWAALGPIAMLIENILGIRRQEDGSILWEIRLLERHGITRYPIGPNEYAQLICEKRHCLNEEPRITVKATKEIAVKVTYGNESILEHVLVGVMERPDTGRTKEEKR